jgi:hypothetical protein
LFITQRAGRVKIFTVFIEKISALYAAPPILTIALQKPEGFRAQA